MPAKATLEAELEAVNGAILKLLNGFESAEWRGKSYRRTDLATLREHRNVVEAELAGIDAGSTMRVRQIVPRG